MNILLQKLTLCIIILCTISCYSEVDFPNISLPDKKSIKQEAIFYHRDGSVVLERISFIDFKIKKILTRLHYSKDDSSLEYVYFNGVMYQSIIGSTEWFPIKGEESSILVDILANLTTRALFEKENKFLKENLKSSISLSSGQVSADIIEMLNEIKSSKSEGEKKLKFKGQDIKMAPH